MTKNMVMECLNGKIIENMKGIGNMVNSMEEELLLYQEERKRKAYGIKERESNGSQLIVNNKLKRDIIYLFFYPIYIKKINFLRCYDTQEMQQRSI